MVVHFSFIVSIKLGLNVLKLFQIWFYPFELSWMHIFILYGVVIFNLCHGEVFKTECFRNKDEWNQIEIQIIKWKYQWTVWYLCYLNESDLLHDELLLLYKTEEHTASFMKRSSKRTIQLADFKHVTDEKRWLKKCRRGLADPFSHLGRWKYWWIGNTYLIRMFLLLLIEWEICEKAAEYRYL